MASSGGCADVEHMAAGLERYRARAQTAELALATLAELSAGDRPWHSAAGEMAELLERLRQAEEALDRRLAAPEQRLHEQALEQCRREQAGVVAAAHQMTVAYKDRILQAQKQSHSERQALQLAEASRESESAKRAAGEIRLAEADQARAAAEARADQLALAVEGLERRLERSEAERQQAQQERARQAELNGAVRVKLAAKEGECRLLSQRMAELEQLRVSSPAGHADGGQASQAEQAGQAEARIRAQLGQYVEIVRQLDAKCVGYEHMLKQPADQQAKENLNQPRPGQSKLSDAKENTRPARRRLATRNA